MENEESNEILEKLVGPNGPESVSRVTESVDLSVSRSTRMDPSVSLATESVDTPVSRSTPMDPSVSRSVDPSVSRSTESVDPSTECSVPASFEHICDPSSWKMWNGMESC